MNEVRIDGLREAVRKLERLGAQASDLKEAFSRIGRIVTREAQALVPVRSGKLRGTIRESKTKNKSVVRAGGSLPYAGVIHYGGYNNIKANPFLTNAVRNKQGEVFDAVEHEIEGLIRRLDLG